MASYQPDNKGARPKTNFQSNSDHKKEKKKNLSLHSVTNMKETARNERKRDNHGSQPVSDVEKDSVPNSEQYDVPPGPQVSPHFCEQPPNLVDLAVIYAKQDYDQVENEFVPWLKDMARKCNLADVRIHLYDDYNINPVDNVFTQTENVSTKCMKILVFITDNLNKDTILTGVVQELIMMTRFISEAEAREHISNLSKNLKPVYVEYLSECVQRQKENALIPVQTTKGRFKFTGLQSILPIPYNDREKNFTERKAQGVIQVAFQDRKKLELLVTIPKNRNRSSYEHSDARSWEEPQANPHATDTLQLISKSSSPRKMTSPQRSGQQNNDVSDDDNRDDCNETSVQSLDQENEKKTEDSASRTDNHNTVCITESSNTAEGSEVGSSAEPGLESDEVNKETGNNQDKGLGSEHSYQSSASTSTGNSTLNTSEDTKTPVLGDQAAAQAPPSDGDDPPQDDLEIDKLESGMADESKNKTTVPRSALTESGYDSMPGREQRQQKEESKPVKESGESSLENSGLVNDSGEAALGKKDSDDTNLKSLKEESMLSTDAQKVEGKSLLHSRKWKSKLEDQDEIREPTLTYIGMPESRGLMAGNVPHKDAGRGSPVGSDAPHSTTQMKGNQPPDFSQTLLPFLTGTNEGPVLTIVHRHLFEKSETKEAAAPSPPPKPAEEVPRTINVIGANTVMIGNNNESVMTKPTIISNSNPDSDKPEPEVVPTTDQTTQKDMQLDSGAESPSSPPTTNPGSINNLSPSLQPSNYNFPKSAEPTNEWKKTDYKKVEGKNAAGENEGRKKEDSCDDSSSDEDNSSVGTGRPTGDVPEGNLKTIKARNWNDMEEQNQITSESGLSSSSWQSEAEDILGPSFSDDLVSLAASQEDTLQQPDDGDQWDAVKSDHCCLTTGQQINAADGQGQGRTGAETCGEETLPFVTGGPQPVNSLHTMSLFASTLSVYQQFHTRAGTLKTNALGMVAHNTMFLQEVTRVDHHTQDDDVD